MTCQHLNMEGGKCKDCEYCLHEVIYFGLCAVCGNGVEGEGNSSKGHIDMNHKTTGITVSLKEAKRLEKEDERRLLRVKKLSLIIDLDQTILHAAWEPHIAKWVDDNKQDERVKEMSTFSLDGSMNKYTIKLRPGLKEFLTEMSNYYEMHIYTMGTRAYADAVARVIDSDGTLFQDRILSRDENGNMTKKRLERLFPSDQTKVVVLDDRVDVWDHSPNLIQIKPYEYFAGIGDINAPPNQSKNTIIPTTTVDDITKNDVNNVPLENSTYTPKSHDPDTILPIVQNVLLQVHKEFYEQMDKDPEAKPNVATILSSLKARILKDCFIVFSGVIPLQYKPEDSSIWKMATSFGATCMAELTGKVTHLIAANVGTSKVNTARKYNTIKIVSPSWLTNSVWEWKRQDEEDHLIPLPREGSTASEVENPEESSLDFFDDKLDNIEWDDDEVDAVLGDDDDFDESSSQSKNNKSEEEEEDDDDDVDDWLGKELNDIEQESESEQGVGGKKGGGFQIYGKDGKLINGQDGSSDDDDDDNDVDLNIPEDDQNSHGFDSEDQHDDDDVDEIRLQNREYNKRKRDTDEEEDEDYERKRF